MKKILVVFLFFGAYSAAFSQTGAKQDSAKLQAYRSEDILVENKEAGIKLAGTLTIPEGSGRHPVVVLISGNGEHNRDAEFSGHKPFLIIADYLTRNGIAVFRFDKRGVGASEGDYKTATTFDFASDVSAAVEYLGKRKELDKKKIGLIGHSEGGLIAPIVASKSRNVNFIVLLAAPAIPGDELLLLQQTLIAKAKGTPESEILKSKGLNQKAFDIVKRYTNNDELQLQMTNYITEISKDDPDKPANMTNEEYVRLQVDHVLRPWMVNFLRYDPAKTLEKVKCPVFAIIGSKDLQVSPHENMEALKKALTKGGNTGLTTKELPGLNHLFQECETGLPGEYNRIEQAISPIAMSEMLNWLKKQIR